MRVLGLVLLFLSLHLEASTEIITQIHEVDFGNQLGDEVLVYLKSGHVAKLKNWNQELINNFQEAKLKNKWFIITLDDHRSITSVKSSPDPMKINPSFVTNEKENYVMTTIKDIPTAKKYFREARRTWKEETQCFNRAMVWTYEWWKNHSLKSGKLLVFFNRNYIRRYNFEWWFHITPYIHVKDETGKVVERTMDVKYSSGPLEFRKWTDIFMRNNAACTVISRYNEYADFPYSGECFLFRTHMYTYQPADLQMYDAWGYTKTSFNMDEVKGAYLEAFDISL